MIAYIVKIRYNTYGYKYLLYILSNIRGVVLKKEENTEVGYEKEIARYNHRKIILIAIISCFIIACFFYIINKVMNRSYNSYKVLHTTEGETDNRVCYASYKGGVLKYSRDGISALTARGKVVWNVSFNIKNPKVSICETYVGVADLGGKQAYVIDEKGNFNTISTALTISDVRVSKQGVLCLTLEGSDYNQIVLYNGATGTILVEKQTAIQTNGFPINVAISNSATKMICSYIKTENGVLESDVGFYNFNEVGENYEEKLVGVLKDQQSIVQDTVFLTNTKALLSSDKGFALYEIVEIPDKIKSHEFKGEIISFIYSEKYFGYIVKTQTEGKTELFLYNLEGKEILRKNITFTYKDVKLYGNDIIFTQDSEILIYTIKGRTKCKASYEAPIVDILPCNNKNEYIVISDHGFQQIKLVEDKE